MALSLRGALVFLVLAVLSASLGDGKRKKNNIPVFFANFGIPSEEGN